MSAANKQSAINNLSIQSKMLVIILPLIVIPMLILASVGFVTSSREAAKTSTRYLKQRENDLRTIAIPVTKSACFLKENTF